MKQSCGWGGGESGNICYGNNNFTQELKYILKSMQYKKYFPLVIVPIIYYMYVHLNRKLKKWPFYSEILLKCESVLIALRRDFKKLSGPF